MKKEIIRLSELLQQLIASCAEHDITTDIFVRPADPVTYQTALDGIRRSIACIGASGISPGELEQAIDAATHEQGPFLEGMADPKDLIPLLGGEFTPCQQDIIRETCREWAAAVEPPNPGGLAELLAGAVHPLTLADLLTPEMTRMQRFPAMMLLQAGARGSGPVQGSGRDTGDRILILRTDDPGILCGQVNQGIFLFLTRNRYTEAQYFPGLVLQALLDAGIFRFGGYHAIESVYGEDGPLVRDLFDAGRDLCKDRESITDIRRLYEAAYATLTAGERPVGNGERAGGGGLRFSPDLMDRLGGHVLAGSAVKHPGETEGTGIRLILAFSRSVACQLSGRTEPGAAGLRNLEENVSGIEHLFRVVTGDYAWRAVQHTPGPGEYRPGIDILPKHHMILYDPRDIAYRSPVATRGLVMEALYRWWFAPRVDSGDPFIANKPWFALLFRVLVTPRVVRTGTGLHPGIRTWLDHLCYEEYGPVAYVADRTRISRLSPHDLFLHAALFEGRAGEIYPGSRDSPVIQALEATRAAREEITRAGTPDPVCLTIIREQIWPVFVQLFPTDPEPPSSGIVTHEESRVTGSPQLTCRGSTPRVDTLVPSPHQPAGNTSGKTIPGEGPNLLNDDSLHIPGVSPKEGRVSPEGGGGRMGKVTGNREETRSGTGSGQGTDTAGSREGMAQISRTAGDMADACTDSQDLLQDMQSSIDRNSWPDQPAGTAGDPREVISTLNERAAEITDLARSLEKQVCDINKASIQGTGKTIPGVNDDGPAGTGEEWDRLRMSVRQVSQAAREYKDMIGELEQQMENPGADPDACKYRIGMTKDALKRLQKVGTEFQQLAVATAPPLRPGEEPLKVPVPDAQDDVNPGGIPEGGRRGRLEPAFILDSVQNTALWESFSYFDASFGEDDNEETVGSTSGRYSRDMADRRFEQGEQALTREAESYLGILRQRSRSDWETIDEKAERIRRIALLESHVIGQDDYAMYLRFSQPVAGMIGVARKNIQQALQKNRPSRDQNELITGDDIDEENLAAVRTTMRIFKDTGREPDRTGWCLSLLIDASSSMHDETVARKLEATIQAAILFGEAVNRIAEIRFEIAAFADTEYIPLKRYQDDWNVHQGCFLIRQVISASGGTNDVGAVSSALDRMNRLRMAVGTNRMIFVISDGQSGVGGREQMRGIMAMNKGTRIFGWGIGPDMEKIEETYRPYGTWVPDIADLPRSLGEVLRRELGRPAMAGWQDERHHQVNGQQNVSGGNSCTN
ncbi:MAG: VWA domain-containing protein [Methanoregulaceae archaeon]|nr:VWA domain-containing protein [Methanoregulaceae archaeon]